MEIVLIKWFSIKFANLKKEKRKKVIAIMIPDVNRFLQQHKYREASGYYEESKQFNIWRERLKDIRETKNQMFERES